MVTKNCLEELPSGYVLLANDEIIKKDDFLFRSHWTLPERWSKANQYNPEIIGFTVTKANAYYNRPNSIIYFARSGPRFKSEKPFPWGY